VGSSGSLGALFALYLFCYSILKRGDREGYGFIGSLFFFFFVLKYLIIR